MNEREIIFRPDQTVSDAVFSASSAIFSAITMTWADLNREPEMLRYAGLSMIGFTMVFGATTFAVIIDTLNERKDRK